MADREAQFAAMGDLLDLCLTRADAQVVDLGIGPGSLSHRLLTRFPRMRIVGVDNDPLLLELAETAYGETSLARCAPTFGMPSGMPP